MNLTDETLARLEELSSLPGGRKALHQIFAEPRSFLNKAKWVESIAQRSAAFQGEMVPWFNYGVVRLLRERVSRTMRVFEFGSGYSTIWWEKNAGSTHAVEHEQAWADILRPMLSSGTVLEHRALDVDGRYCRAIAETDEYFDIVVVDGRDRVNCLVQSIPRLSPKGIVIFDNSQRKRYRNGIEAVKQQHGMKELQFAGIAPMTYVESFTSVLYQHDNCFGI